MGNVCYAKKQRICDIKSAENRLESDELARLKESFTRLFPQGRINEPQFSQLVLGSIVPPIIAGRLFSLFHTNTKRKTMDYGDFIVMYALLKKGDTDEKAHICFSVLSMQNDRSITYQGLNAFGIRILQLNARFSDEFYHEHSLSKQVAIDMETFTDVYRRAREHPLFTWLDDLFKEPNGLVNAMESDDEEEADEGKKAPQSAEIKTKKTVSEAVPRSLTMIKKAQIKRDTKEYGFDDEEFEKIDAFYKRFYQNRKSQDALKMFKGIFKDLQLP